MFNGDRRPLKQKKQALTRITGIVIWRPDGIISLSCKNSWRAGGKNPVYSRNIIDCGLFSGGTINRK